jgi:hypothetical protein
MGDDATVRRTSCPPAAGRQHADVCRDDPGGFPPPVRKPAPCAASPLGLSGVVCRKIVFVPSSRPGRWPGPMRKIMPVSKTSIRVETRHIGPAARLTPVPSHAVERRALAMTSAPRSALAGWSCGKSGEGNGRQTDRQRRIHEQDWTLAERLQVGTPRQASAPVPSGPFPLMPTL